MSTAATAKAFPAVPRDARHAASAGFDFRQAITTCEDDFTGASTMLREGEMELTDTSGNQIVIPFQAKFTFGKPRPVKPPNRAA